MHRRFLTFAVVVLALTFFPIAGVVGQQEQEPEQAQAGSEAEVAQEQDVEPAAGYFFWAGGIAKAKRARTQTTGSLLGGGGAWVGLPGAGVAYTVPAGTADTFNVAFSAECQKVAGGLARIRVLLDAGAGGAFEPYDGGQTFCSSGLPATQKGNWIRRVGAGAHSVTVQFRNTAGTVWIDDWTLELVVHE